MSNGPIEKHGYHGTASSIERHGGLKEPWQDDEWQRLWLAVERCPWRSLALVPAGPSAGADFSLVVAMTLSRTAMVHVGSPLQVADGTSVSLSQLTAFCNEVSRCTSGGQRLLVALPAVGDSAVTTSIAQAMDSAVLCVLADKVTSSEAQRTIRLVGRERFLGSALFHPHQLRSTPG